MNALFVLETGKVLGYVPDLPYAGQSHTALFCPACGHVWARVLYPDAKDFVATHKACEKHGDGSFFLSIDDLESITLPEGLAEYEAEVSLRHTENYKQYHRWPIQVSI
jgi:hypothetical protein